MQKHRGESAAPMSVTSEFVVSQESLDAMLASPAAAVAGLTTGIAEGLRVESSAVEITRTVPDLLGGRRLAVGRRLSRATLTVDFDVAVLFDATVAAKVESFTSGDATVAAKVKIFVQRDLAAQNIKVTIVSVAASPTRGDTQTPPETSSGTNAPIPSSNIQTDIEESHGRGLGILFFLFFAVLRH